MSIDANKGYVGHSMSVRAAEAYSSGAKPKSKWTKADMLAAIEEVAALDKVEVPENLGKLTKEAIFAHLFSESSWHHTSKFYNKTVFYEVDEKAVCALTEAQVNKWLEESAEEKAEAKKVQITSTDAVPDSERVYVEIEFTEWIGSRNYSSPHEQVGYGELRGDWCLLQKESEGGCSKKKVKDTRNCRITNVFHSEGEMLRHISFKIAYEAVDAWWGSAVSAVIAGKAVRGFVTGPCLYPKSMEEYLWNMRGEFLALHVVDANGEVTEVEPVPESGIEIKGRLNINELRREGTSQSVALVKMHDKHRKFSRKMRQARGYPFF